MQANLTPIALFVYKRADKTMNTLQSLAACSTFEDRPLYIFSDGPKSNSDAKAVSDVRAVIKGFHHPDKNIRVFSSNRGLAVSIIDGVTEICAAHGRVIVMEDDLIVSPEILDYFDEALDAYQDDACVMQISGFAFGQDKHSNEARFLPMTTSWGWATWQRAWQTFDPEETQADVLEGDPQLQKKFNLNGLFDFSGMVARQMRGEVDSWAARWYLHVFLNNGLVLYPHASMVQNDGMDRSGTHGFRSALLWRKQFDVRSQKRPRLPNEVKVSANAIKMVGRFVDPYGLRRIASHLSRILK